MYKKFYSPPTNISFGGGPKNKDAFEEASVVLAESTIPSSGDGIFAVRDIEKGHTFHNESFSNLFSDFPT